MREVSFVKREAEGSLLVRDLVVFCLRPTAYCLRLTARRFLGQLVVEVDIASGHGGGAEVLFVAPAGSLVAVITTIWRTTCTSPSV